jgi:hypothetical protein
LDRGDSWERISPDLTYNEKDKMGDIPFQTIFSISESPLKFGLIYVGTDDGRVHVTRNGGEGWAEITDGLPYRKWVSRVTASAFDIGTVYLAQNGKRDDDFAAYLWKSTNFGKNWKDISNNIPCGPINVIREDPRNRNILYVGTDLGVYVSVDGAQHWHTLAKNLPTTYVHDLVIHPRDQILVCATHGRGMYALDVRYLEQLTEGILNEKVHLFDIDDARLPEWRWWQWQGGQKACIYYYLKEAQGVKLYIKDNEGKKIKELEGTGDAGMNVAIWDLTGAGEKDTENRSMKESFVNPGIYSAVLTWDSNFLEVQIKVNK